MIYRFDDFSLDPTRFELFESGKPIAVEPQVFNLLLHLLEHADRVVSKEELIDEIWSGRSISDTTLSSRIFALRRAVGDSGDKQAIIKTIPRRGFRFVAEFSACNGSSVQHYAPELPADDTQPEAVTLPLTDVELRVSSSSKHPVLVVLPFKNSSSVQEQNFCDGLTEDIIANLTHFSEVRVIASSTSFRFKNLNLSHSEIAAEVGAVYIVEGSIRRDGNRIRIAVQLIEAVSGVSLWAEKYDREIEDIFAVQDEVTHMIAASLGIRMQNAELARALRKAPSDMNAYECVLYARRYTATMNEDMHFDARRMLEKAIGLDPNYAEAHALLANVYLAEIRIDANLLPNSIERALAMALKAVELDSQSAYARCWLAIVHFFRKDFGNFETEMDRALGLNPNDPEILAEAGHYYSFKGDFDRGIEFARRAQELNPLHPGWYHFAYALLHYRQCRYEEMITDVKRISMPHFFWPHMLTAASLGQLGRIDEAKAALAVMRQRKPGVSPTVEMTKWNFLQRDLDHMLEGLRSAGLEE